MKLIVSEPNQKVLDQTDSLKKYESQIVTMEKYKTLKMHKNRENKLEDYYP